MKLVKSTNFIRAAKKFIKKYPDLAIDINTTLRLLSENPFDKKLKTHKLKGELINYWGCSINYQMRLVFRFVKAINVENGQYEDAILLSTIGSHDEVY